MRTRTKAGLIAAIFLLLADPAYCEGRTVLSLDGEWDIIDSKDAGVEPGRP